MAKFTIIEKEKVLMAYTYEVEAETKEEALQKYTNELAGSLPIIDTYVCDGSKEETIVTN